MINADPALAQSIGILAFATFGAAVIAGAALEAFFARRARSRRP